VSACPVAASCSVGTICGRQGLSKLQVAKFKRMSMRTDKGRIYLKTNSMPMAVRSQSPRRTGGILRMTRSTWGDDVSEFEKASFIRQLI
jgi:hypothetical protein